MAVWLDGLESMVEEGDEMAILGHLQQLVPEYTPAARWRTAATAVESEVRA
jgi:hypothetical protein